MVNQAPIIPIMRPWMDDCETEAARRVILSGWVTQGPEVANFEKEFCLFTGSSHACAVSSCTTALHLALLALGVGHGDEVITASHSFIASANSIRYCGAVPVFVDIQPDTFNMDPTFIEQVITDRTRAILCIHQMGMPCDINSILDIGKRHQIPVIEDAACAIGSEILWEGKWEKIGRPHGLVSCFSFHPRKLISCGDGGMITTNDPVLDHKFRLLRHHGMGVSDSARHSSKQVVFESYEALGYNYRMTDIQAAVGREQLKKLPKIITHRQVLARQYFKLLAEIPDLGLPFEPSWARSNWQSLCIRLPQGCSQRDVMQALLDMGIHTRRGIMCAHREKAYPVDSWSCGVTPRDCSCTPGSCSRLAISEKAQDECILLPLYYQMQIEDVERVVTSLSDVINKIIVSSLHDTILNYD